MKISEQLVVHQAFTSWLPLELEKFGDSQRGLFDRWLCYRRALHHCADLESPEAKRILAKIADLEMDRDYNAFAFANVEKDYTEIIDYLRQTGKDNSFDFDKISNFLKMADNSGRSLRNQRQQFSFVSGIKNYLQEIFYALLYEKSSLRRQNQHLLLNLKGFNAKRLCLTVQETGEQFLIVVKDNLTIGAKDHDNDLYVTGDGFVSDFHGFVSRNGADFEVSRGDTPFHLWIQRGNDNVLVLQSTKLQNEDRLMLGKIGTADFVSVRFRTFQNEETHEIESVALNVEKGTPKNRHCILFFSRCTIGRNETSSIQLDEKLVSRNHAYLIYDKGGFWLLDGGSRNGTFINNEVCPAEATPLLLNDMIQIGRDLHIVVS